MMKNMLKRAATVLAMLTATYSLAAGPDIIQDTTTGGATHNGTVGGGEYVGSTEGINSGFGGGGGNSIIGSNAFLHVDSDLAGRLYFGLVVGGGSLVNVGVVYIDSVSGGVSGTSGLTDTADPGRRMVSGSNDNGSSHLTFASGFEADYAIAFDQSNANLFKIVAGGSHTYIKSANMSTTDGGTSYEFYVELSDIGLAPGDQFDYIATYADPNAAGGFYRSDEFQGVAASTVTGGNIGVAPVSLAAYDFNTFISVESGPQKVIIDTTSGTATKDGTVGVSEYVDYSVGINGSFGDRLGDGSRLHIDSSRSGTLSFGLETSVDNGLSDHSVIYIDSVSGGVSNTTGLTDYSDDLRAMISGKNANGGSDITFAPGFTPDYAIGFNSGYAALWQIREGIAHLWLKSCTMNNTGPDYEWELSLSDIGLSAGGSFKYMATHANAIGGTGLYRSDEFHGVSGDTVSAGDIGVSPVSMRSGDYNIFSSFDPARLDILVDFGPANDDDGRATISPDVNGNHWNNWRPKVGDIGIVAGTTLSNLVNTDGAPTAVGLEVTTSFSAANGIRNGGLDAPDGPQASLLGNFAIETATEDYFYDAGTAGIKISGLNVDGRYRLRLFSSRTWSSGNRTTGFEAVGGNGTFTTTLVAGGPDIADNGTYDGNDDEIAELESIAPNGSGEIQLNITVEAGAAYLNIMEIVEIATSGSIITID